MAVVKNIKEKVHLPIYDSINVEPEKQLREVESSSTLKFFVNVQNKTKLETNLQAASLLPHYNTFEARAMRVVISDLPPEFPDDPTADNDDDLEVTNANDLFFDGTGAIAATPVTTTDHTKAVTADVELGVSRIVDLYQQANDSDDGTAELDPDDEDVTLKRPAGGAELNDAEARLITSAGGKVTLKISDLDALVEKLAKAAPPT